RPERLRMARHPWRQGRRLRLPSRPLHPRHDRRAATASGPLGVHDARDFLSGRDHGDRVPDQPRPDRRRPLPVPRAAAQARGCRRLARPRRRARGVAPALREMLDGMIDLRLAPMAAVTNAPFRLVARECGAGRLTSEEIDARGLVEGSARTAELASFLPEEHPIALQLLGGDPAVPAEAARRLEAAGADAIDLNMGCPVAKIVAKGQGAALMRDPWRAAMIFRAMRKAVTVPQTAKIRGGWDERAPNAVEIARVAEDEGVDALTVHPRTRSQQFSGRAPWDVIGQVVAAVRMPVTGN